MRAALVALLLVHTLAGCSCGNDRGARTKAVAETVAETNADDVAETDVFVVGAVDDAARHPGHVLGQLDAAGFGALGITSYWEPGNSAPLPDELAVLRDVAARAANRNLRVFVSIFHRGSATTPLTPAERAAFSSYVAAVVREVPTIRDVIVGNEPNLNRFWLPQFGENGENLAAVFYLALLAEVYDATKAVAPATRIWGGALAPRGVDKPNTGRDTHSPATFIRDLGAELRKSGRTRPVLDGFAFHPYPAASNIPPDRPHPGSRTIGLADHERLRRLLREAFDRDLPILYSEFGVETAIPAGKARLYEGAEPGEPVDEATQADFYRRALELAACQEGVVGMLLFHSHDEPFLTGFQSGVYYVDGARKASFEPVRDAILHARRGC
ncbi:MAG: hypothetical protein H0X21_08510 [Actinobacteria bacterium]|nr:hypothetical protein [Actinomycetota bacterium]